MRDQLDPQVRLYLEAAEAQGKPPLESLAPAEARIAAAETMEAVRGVPEPVASIENVRIPGPEGEIPLRIYTPLSGAPRPALMFFHGGGWVLSNLDTHHVVCTLLAHRSGAVVISVDYRLAPEHRFPAAVTDCYAATEWAAANAERLGADPRRLCVCGDSAGGNLAAVVALKSRDENGPAIALQALVYPVLDLGSFDTASYRTYADGYFLTRSLMEWFRGHYLGRPEDACNPYASPLCASDLRGLPPALIITAECDPLLDENEAYAKRLQEAGVPVTYTCYSGMIHPFFTLPGVTPRAYAAIDEIAGAVRGASGTPLTLS